MINHPELRLPSAATGMYKIGTTSAIPDLESHLAILRKNPSPIKRISALVAILRTPAVPAEIQTEVNEHVDLNRARTLAEARHRALHSLRSGHSALEMSIRGRGLTKIVNQLTEAGFWIFYLDKTLLRGKHPGRTQRFAFYTEGERSKLLDYLSQQVQDE